MAYCWNYVSDTKLRRHEEFDFCLEKRKKG